MGDPASEALWGHKAESGRAVFEARGAIQGEMGRMVWMDCQDGMVLEVFPVLRGTWGLQGRGGRRARCDAS